MPRLTDHETALDCLAKLAPWRAEDRECWFKCAAALKSVNPDLYAAFERWSSSAQNFSAKACRATWKSAPTDKVTLGTLITWARQDGAEIDTGQSDRRLEQLREAKAKAPEDAPHVDREWSQIASQAQATAETVQPLADNLGLSPTSLQRLGVGWLGREALAQHGTKCSGAGCWTFPMSNLGGVCGIRLRTPDGFKYAVHSSDGLGLFVPSGVPGATSPLFVIEGPTDTGAVLDMGESCIGRPNNVAGNDLIRKWVTLHRPATRDVVIVMDRDQPDSDMAAVILRRIVDQRLTLEAARELADDAGLTQAERGTVVAAVELARLIARDGRTATVVAPPLGVKDARAWLAQSPTNDDLWGLVDQGVVIRGRRYGWLCRGVA